MTDDITNALPETESEIPEVSATPLIKSNKKIWIIAGIVIFFICICSIVGVFLIVKGAGSITSEKAPLETILDTFMIKMEAQEFEGAYALFSPRAQRQIPIIELEKLGQGNNTILFKGYESITIQGLNIATSVNTNPDLPQGIVANINGTITYSGGFSGQLSAILEKVDGVWMIDKINVTVPPDKLESGNQT
jgi:hypothetical protein